MTPEVPTCDQGKPRKAELLARWGPPAMWVLAVVLAVHLVQFVNNGFDRPAHGFVSHYTASRLVVRGVKWLSSTTTTGSRSEFQSTSRP